MSRIIGPVILRLNTQAVSLPPAAARCSPAPDGRPPFLPSNCLVRVQFGPNCARKRRLALQKSALGGGRLGNSRRHLSIVVEIDEAP